MQNLTLLDGPKFQITIQRLCRQLIENHDDFSNTVFIGTQPRGIYLARRVAERAAQNTARQKPFCQGDMDVTFYRDDFRRGEKYWYLIKPASTSLSKAKK